MKDSLSKFLKVKDDAVYFKGEGEFIFFVPEIFFERNHAIPEGDIVYLIGLLNYSVVKPGGDITKNVKRFNLPTVFTTKPGKIEKVKNIKLKENAAPGDYRLFRYADNGVDQIMVSMETPQDISNVEEFMNIAVTTGKIPYGIKYEDLYAYPEASMNMNGGSFKAHMQMFGVIFGELCRDPEDNSKPFRLSKTFDKDPYGYDLLSIKELAKNISPFTSIVTENWDEAVINAGLIDEKDAIPTPMERIMTGE